MANIRIENISYTVKNLFTRFPFKYGIASLTGLPHVFTKVDMQIDGKAATGLTAEHLPPKWFTKNPNTRFEEDLPDLIRVVTHAGDLLVSHGNSPKSYFELWQALYQDQAGWAQEKHLAPLLANLGVSIAERAVIDGLCRHLQQPFASVVKENHLGINLGAVRPELGGLQPADFLPAQPLAQVTARHTVGLGDPLYQNDVAPDERINDGLPHVLEDAITTYGIRYFKIKLCGNLDTDRDRLRLLGRLFEKHFGNDYHFTLDGNENFATVDQFVEHWDAYHEDEDVSRLMKQLIFVEQPLHRDVALDDRVRDALAGWENRPPLIIDESDANLESLPQALSLGYNGTSHKNCKGIVKGLANAALLAKRKQDSPDTQFILSGEDLSNVGPIQLLQDLCVMTTLGIDHVERNGHHYFKGIADYDASIQAAILDNHGDLFHQAPSDFATLTINNGHISAQSVNQHYFGVAPLFDAEPYTSLDQWDPASLGD